MKIFKLTTFRVPNLKSYTVMRAKQYFQTLLVVLSILSVNAYAENPVQVLAQVKPSDAFKHDNAQTYLAAEKNKKYFDALVTLGMLDKFKEQLSNCDATPEVPKAVCQCVSKKANSLDNVELFYDLMLSQQMFMKVHEAGESARQETAEKYTSLLKDKSKLADIRQACNS